MKRDCNVRSDLTCATSWLVETHMKEQTASLQHSAT
jgi:hypothetical protein